MHLSSFRVFNYKSFIDSETLELKPGINLIVGQNNAGKSSLLEVLTLNFQSIIHESLVSKSTKETNLSGESIATFRVTVEPAELRKILQKDNGLAFDLPKSFDLNDIDQINSNQAEAYRVLNLLNSQLEKENSLIGTYDSIDGKIVELFMPIDQVNELPDKYWQSRESDSLKNRSLLAHDFKNGRFDRIQLTSGVGLLKSSLKNFVEGIFIFSAKRIEVEISRPVDGLELKSDCSNLAGVISNLSAEHRNMFDELMDLVSSVVPPVKDIFAKRQSHSSGGFEYLLKISAYPGSLRRNDLAKNLTDCGTGIGQVIALLFVIVTSETPRIILIDEIQSFLHPGAVKKLLEIFNNHPIKHQFILTTHSTEVLNNAHPSNIILVDIENGVSKAKSINKNNYGDIQQVFRSLGMNLSDYSFGHHLLWVEGATEKEIFPLLCPDREDVSVLVIESSIIYQKRKEAVKLACNLVKKLSIGENIPNRTVSIVFDRENLTESRIKELKDIAGGILHILPRRMTENYLLHPKCISELLSEIDETIIDEKTISEWIEEKFTEGWINPDKFEKGIIRKEWLNQVHGANLLGKLFNEITESRCNYNAHKIQLGYELTKRILINESNFLDELKDFYNSFLK